ncbi:MAG: helix-turn-helix transcriptional regulator [Dehalococcoidales bacterium]|nr:helix-turn-helix transcriptional regulator [Dehalococcoidales bacterium]
MENWEKVSAVRRMLDYIEQHINEPVTLYDLSQAAGYSPWHSDRLFKEITGRSPFEFIRAIRLSRAAERLKDKNCRIVDVAFDFVFRSHEGFSRAFSRQFGISPHQFRKNKMEVDMFSSEHARDYYLNIQKGEEMMTKNSAINTVFVQVVDRSARKLILKRGTKASDYFAYCEEVGCEIWNILSGIKEALYEPIGMWLPENLRPAGTSVYAMGVEVPAGYCGPIPEGYDIIDLKPCKMMIFQGQPYPEEKFQEAIGELWEVMKTYNPEIYGFAWADDAGPRFQLEPRGYRGYIEGRPVRQISPQ